jgi:hypothetical protein
MTPGELKILMALDKLSKPYDAISGFFTLTNDGVWDIALNDIINETGLTLDKGAISDGYVELILVNAFDEVSPYSRRDVQVFSSISMHPSDVVSCQIVNDDPDLVLIYMSLTLDGNPGARGLGFGKDFPFSFEIRLYKA